MHFADVVIGSALRLSGHRDRDSFVRAGGAEGSRQIREHLRTTLRVLDQEGNDEPTIKKAGIPKEGKERRGQATDRGPNRGLKRQIEEEVAAIVPSGRVWQRQADERRRK